MIRKSVPWFNNQKINKKLKMGSGTMKKLLKNFLRNYPPDNYLRFKKAQYVFIFSSSILASLLILSISGFFILDSSRMIEIAKSSSLLSLSCIIIILLVKSGRVEIAANTLAFTACLIAAAGFLTRPYYLSGVTMGVFMHLAVAFATLYCSFLVSSTVLAVFFTTHTYFYITVAKPAATGFLIQTVNSTFIDGLITLTLLFVLGTVTARFLNRAVHTAESESEKNRENYSHIKSLITTIRNASAELNESINQNYNVITKYSDNVQSEAASMEELSATVEEISAGTESVSKATDYQKQSIEELSSSINALSVSIDSIENHGNAMKDTLVSFLKNAEKGSMASGTLDSINKKILQNSNDITLVITIIEEFFDKINLLSLNAAIEAARAGEHGRGFAVVAEEIGKLADHSTQELNRISDLIETNKKDAAESNTVINQILEFINETMSSLKTLQQNAVITVKALEEQKKLKTDMDVKTRIAIEKTGMINIAMKEQQTAVEGIALSIEDTGKTIQQNADNTIILQDSADRLKQLSSQIEKEIT